MMGVDNGAPGVLVHIQLLIDSGVHKTLLSENDQKKIIRLRDNGEQIKLKINRAKFRPYWTNI